MPASSTPTRPPPLSDPDKLAWKARHGTECRDLTGHPRLPIYVEQAEELHESDWSTLSNDVAHTIHAEMDAVCTRVASLFRLVDVALVAYDHARKVFVAMPYGPTRRG